MGYPEYPYDTIYPPEKMPLYHLKRKIELRIEVMKNSPLWQANAAQQLQWVLAEIDKIL